jgi:NADH-quinone oxidoreductase subunit N
LATGTGLWLVIFSVLMAAVSVYYYFRVIQAMYFREGQANIEASTSFKLTLGAVAALVILLGLFPGLLIYFYYF